MEQKQPDQPQDEAAERRARFDAFIEHLQRDPFEEIDEPGDQGLVVGGRHRGDLLRRQRDRERS